VLAEALGGVRIPVPSCDPLGRPVTGEVLLCAGTGYVESAQACGLHLLAPDERDPRATSSYGLGALIIAAVEAGARTVVVGVGGTGTNDGGAGALAALGVAPLDSAGYALPSGGAALAGVAALDGAPRLRGVALVLAADVDAPLTGVYGASAVFGPQKGADRAGVLLLDAALDRFGQVLERDLPGCPAGLAQLPGAGAGGGLGAALLALGARRESGIRLVRELVGLDAVMDRVDLVLTGEGSFDAQSLRGKVVAGVAGAARDRGLPCLVLAGRVDIGRREAAATGVTATYSLVETVGAAAALADPVGSVAALAARIAPGWSRR
jgi:glycerate kinase